MEPVYDQIVRLFLLGIPIACVSWTVTHEEIFKELRDWCQSKSDNCSSLAKRKFFYLPTCEYCFSHHVAAFFLFITEFKMLYSDWRGYLVSLFSLVWVANTYMGLFGRLRLDIKRERVEIKKEEIQGVDRPLGRPVD